MDYWHTVGIPAALNNHATPALVCDNDFALRRGRVHAIVAIHRIPLIAWAFAGISKISTVDDGVRGTREHEGRRNLG